MNPNARTITFPQGLNPSAITSQDETRYIINHCLIEQGHAIATDGRTMIVAQIFDSEPRSTTLLTKEAISAACEPKKDHGGVRFDEVGTLRLDPDSREACITTLFPKGSLRFEQPGEEDIKVFPNWSQVVPENVAGRFRFGLDASLLLKLAKALGSKGGQIHLHIDLSQTQGPAFVTHSPTPSAFGIIMPLRETAGSEPPSLEKNSAVQHALRRMGERKAATLTEEAKP